MILVFLLPLLSLLLLFAAEFAMIILTELEQSPKLALRALGAEQAQQPSLTALHSCCRREGGTKEAAMALGRARQAPGKAALEHGCR